MVMSSRTEARLRATIQQHSLGSYQTAVALIFDLLKSIAIRLIRLIREP